MWRALSRYFRIENARQAAIPTSEGLSLEPSWMALAINNASLIVGQGMFHVESWKKGEIIKLPAVVLWNQGAIIKLPILPGGRSSEVNDINETGQIVGLSYRYSMNDCRAVLWKEGQVFELPISPLLASDDYTGAADINDRGRS